MDRLFLAGIVFGLVGVFIVGAVVEWFIARRLYRSDHLDHVLVTFGLILIFDTLVHLLWGAEGMAIPLPDSLNGQVTIGELVLADLSIADHRLRPGGGRYCSTCWWCARASAC